MSLTWMLILAAVAAPIVVFADSLTQWSLRQALSEGSDYGRAKVAAQEVAERQEDDSVPASAQAA